MSSPFLSYSHFDETRCLKLIEKNPHLIEKFSKKQRTYSVCVAAAKKYCLAVRFLPEDERPDWHLSWVKQDGMKLNNIPESERTSELIKEALNQNVEAFQFISEKYQTPEMIKNVIEQCAWLFQFSKPSKRTPEINFLAISRNKNFLKYLNYEEKTFELCKMALSDPSFYERNCIPEKYLTPETLRKVLKERNFYDFASSRLLFFPKTNVILTICVKHFPKFLTNFSADEINSGFIF